MTILRKQGAAREKEKWSFRESGRPGLGVYRAVAKGDGALLVEITGYVDMPMQIQAEFEEMAGTFTLLS